MVYGWVSVTGVPSTDCTFTPGGSRNHTGFCRLEAPRSSVGTIEMNASTLAPFLSTMSRIASDGPATTTLNSTGGSMVTTMLFRSPVVTASWIGTLLIGYDLSASRTVSETDTVAGS